MTQAPGSPAAPPPARPTRSGDNLQAAAFPDLAQADQNEALQVLYRAVVEKARQTIGWYAQRKRRHKSWGLSLRIGAVLLAGLASITPIIIAMIPPNPPFWDPVRLLPLASLLAAGSAGCIGLDKLLGHSASWMRYQPTMLELEAQLETLQFAWSRRALEGRSLQGSPQEQLTTSLNLLQESLTKVQQTLKLETLEWVTQFSGNLQEFEKSLVAQRAALPAPSLPATGALKIEITNFDDLSGHSYRIQLGNASPSEHTHATAAFTGLTIGQFKLLVSASRENKSVSAEDVVTIQPGETATVKLTL